MSTVKSILFVTVLPMFLVVCFKSNQINLSKVNRSPAVIAKGMK